MANVFFLFRNVKTEIFFLYILVFVIYFFINISSLSTFMHILVVRLMTVSIEVHGNIIKR